MNAIGAMWGCCSERNVSHPVRCISWDTEVSWSFWLIAIPTGCYLAAACVYGSKGNWPLAVVYSGYCWANLGLLALDMKT